MSSALAQTQPELLIRSGEVDLETLEVGVVVVGDPGWPADDVEIVRVPVAELLAARVEVEADSELSAHQHYVLVGGTTPN